MKHFIVIDMQKDFCTGALKNDNAVAVIPFIKEKLVEAKKNGDNIIFTKDTHTEDYLNTTEGKHLPVVHCIKDTDGWNIVDDFKDFFGDTTFVMKNHFGYDHWTNIIKPGDEVTICGTVASICVTANVCAIKQIEGVEVTVLSKGCADISQVGFDAAMEVCRCQQATVI